MNTKKKEKRVALRFLKKGDFLDRFLPERGIGGFHWGAPTHEIGMRIAFDISFVGANETFILVGEVVYADDVPKERPHLPFGVGIEFLPEAKERLAALIEFVSHEDDEHMRVRDDRQEARLPVELSCDYLHKRKPRRGKVVDITTTGLRVETDDPLPKGTEFIFFLNDPRYVKPFVLEANVIWSKTKEDPSGFGAQLKFDSRKHKTDVTRYVSTLRDEQPLNPVEEEVIRFGYDKD